MLPKRLFSQRTPSSEENRFSLETPDDKTDKQSIAAIGCVTLCLVLPLITAVLLLLLGLVARSYHWMLQGF